MPHQAEEIKAKLKERKAQGFSKEDLKRYFGQLKEDRQTAKYRKADDDEQKKHWNDFWFNYLKRGWNKFRKSHGLAKDKQRIESFQKAPDYREAVIQFQDKVIQEEREKNWAQLEQNIAKEDNEIKSSRWDKLKVQRDLEDEIYRFQDEANQIENKSTFSLSRFLSLHVIRPLENTYHTCAEWFEHLWRKIRHQKDRAGQHLSECGETISVSASRATDAPFHRLGNTVATAFVALGRKISDASPFAASRRKEQEARLFNDEFAKRFKNHQMKLFDHQNKLKEFEAKTGQGIKPTA